MNDANYLRATKNHEYIINTEKECIYALMVAIFYEDENKNKDLNADESFDKYFNKNNKTRKQEYTDRELFDILSDFYYDNGELPTKSLQQYKIIINRFGNLDNALKKAGIPTKAEFKYNKTHQEIEGILYKLCSICGDWIPCTNEYFNKRKTNKVDGFRTHCKNCTTDYQNNRKKYKGMWKELEQILKEEQIRIQNENKGNSEHKFIRYDGLMFAILSMIDIEIKDNK